MSFLYDEEVYLPILIKSFNKTSQTTSDPVLVAKKLVANLSGELSNAPASLNLTSPTNTELKVENLQSIDALVKFLANNKITLDGSRIIYTNAENDALADEEASKLSPISTKLSRNADKTWNEEDYYTNLPLLIKYVAYLQQKSLAMEQNGDAQGKVLEVMVGKLIDQVNAIKPDSGLSRKPKSTPEKPNELSDNLPIDDFGSKTFDIKNPTGDRGSQILSAKDIKSRAALNDWMQQSPEAKIIIYNDKGQRSEIKYSDSKADLCLVINTLYKRALHWSQLAKTPEEERKFAFYLQKIKDIGPTFADPNGKACSIVTGTTEPVSGITGTSGGTGAEGMEAPITAQLLDQMINSLPLDIQDLDFHRILTFFGKYRQILANSTSSRKTEIENAINAAMSAMGQARDLTTTGQNSFNMFAGPSEVVAWLKPPQGNKYMSFLSHLKTVLNNTFLVLKNFYAAYARGKVAFNSEQQAEIESQILGDNSIYKNNWNKLRALEARVNEVISFK